MSDHNNDQINKTANSKTEIFNNDIGIGSASSNINEESGSVEYVWETNSNYQEVVHHELYQESEVMQTFAEGNRLVDIDFYTRKLLVLQQRHSQKCTCGLLQPVREEKLQKKGFVSTIVLMCNMCDLKINISTQKCENVLDQSIVLGTIASGNTFTSMSDIAASMDLPLMSESNFREIQTTMYTTFNNELLLSMKKHGEEEKRIALNKGHINKDGIPFISVYVDGGWAKRSYGHTYNANAGTAVIIGQETKKILFVGVRNKSCLACSRGVSLDKHQCFKNWNGSSGAMEADIVVEGFNKSEEMHGLHYLSIVADGDSSVLKRIRENVSYGSTVAKTECCNHLIKNYGKYLYRMKNNTSLYHITGRRLLTSTKIRELQTIAKRAIYENATAAESADVSNRERLIIDLKQGPYHVFDDHINCREYYCSHVGTLGSNSVETMIADGIFEGLQEALKSLINKGHYIYQYITNNLAESFMALLYKYNCGKRINFTQRGNFQNRVVITALQYNEGNEWVKTFINKYMQKPANYSFMLHLNRKTQKTQLNSKHQKKKKTNKIYTSSKTTTNNTKQRLRSLCRASGNDRTSS